MKPKSIFILAALAGVSVVAAGVSASRDSGPVDAGVGAYVFPGLLERLNEATQLEILDAKQHLTIVRAGDGWVLKESDNYPVRKAKVQKAILGLGDLRTFEAKTRMKDLHGYLHVEDPKGGTNSKGVKLIGKDGNVLADLIVGRTRFDLPGATSDGTYVRKPGDDQSWLVRGNAGINTVIDGWLVSTITDIDVENVKQAVIRHGDGDTLTVSKTSVAAKDFAIADIPEGKKPKSQFDINRVGEALDNFVLEDARKSGAVAFPEADKVVASYETFKGLRVRVEVVKKDKDYWARVHAEGEGDVAKQADEINARTSDWVYKIASYRATDLMQRLANLIDDIKPKAKTGS